MRLIDEKGRLFRKINVVDFLIIIFVLVLLPLFFNTYKILGKMPISVPYQRIKVQAVTFVIPEFMHIFKERDVSFDEYGKVNGKILKITVDDQKRGEVFKNAVERVKRSPQSEYTIPVFIEFELWCTRSEKNEPWYYRRSSLVISMNHSFTFNTGKYSLTCNAMKIIEE